MTLIKRSVLFLILINLLAVLDLNISFASIQTDETICGINTLEFPTTGKEIIRYTCIVDGDSVFDKWVHGLAFAWVDASSERAFQILTDYRNWKRNICNVETVRVVDERENYRKVAWKVVNDGGSTRYTNEYFLYPDSNPKKIEFQYVGPGEVDDMKGEWSIYSIQSTPGQILLRYIVKLNPETVFTEIVKNYVHRNLECLLTDLRAWAEKDSLPVILD